LRDEGDCVEGGEFGSIAESLGRVDDIRHTLLVEVPWAQRLEDERLADDP
jgi:hypothetical protein